MVTAHLGGGACSWTKEVLARHKTNIEEPDRHLFFETVLHQAQTDSALPSFSGRGLRIPLKKNGRKGVLLLDIHRSGQGIQLAAKVHDQVRLEGLVKNKGAVDSRLCRRATRWWISASVVCVVEWRATYATANEHPHLIRLVLCREDWSKGSNPPGSCSFVFVFFLVGACNHQI